MVGTIYFVSYGMTSWNDKEKARREWLSSIPEDKRSIVVVVSWLRSLFPGNGGPTGTGPTGTSRYNLELFWRYVQGNLSDSNLPSRICISYKERSGRARFLLTAVMGASVGRGWSTEYHFSKLQEFLGKFRNRAFPTRPCVAKAIASFMQSRAGGKA